MAKKKTTKKTTKKKKTKKVSKAQQQLNKIKAEALKKIVEHNRDYLKLDITLPLGDTALKNVHTNQWLFTNLPSDFDLVNWTIIAKQLNSNVNRYEGYVKNRWYIDSVTVDVDASGKAEMKLGLNAFASSLSKFADDFKTAEQNYKTATTKTKTTSVSKNTTNAVSTGALINEEWVKKYNISSTIVNKVKEICKEGDTPYNNVRALFQWCDDHLPYEGYSGTQYGAVGTLNHGAGNCCDHAHLFCAMCRSIGVKCNYIHNPCCGKYGHVYNIVYFDGKGTIVDTGRDLASWGSHWGNSGCPTEKESINF